MIGKSFESAAKKKEDKEKHEQNVKSELIFKEANNAFSLDYQIQNDVFFRNKQNYDLMLKSLKIDQFHSLNARSNLKTFQAFSLDYRRRLLFHEFNLLFKDVKAFFRLVF
jgi:hypothetical protein